MRVLVTGAAGFLGFHLARYFSDVKDTTVYCVDNHSRGEKDKAYLELLAKSSVHGIDIDLSVKSDYDKLPESVDYVYHMAALNGTQNFYEAPMEVISSCTLPTMFLIEKYSVAGSALKRFIYAGTSESYASTVSCFDWPVPTSEKVPLCISDAVNPRWSYAISKMHGEVVVNQASRVHGFDATIIRYHNAYGPRMGDKHVVPDFLVRCFDGRYELFGHADTRSFIYVDDVVKATVLVGESDSCANETINVGGTEEITMKDLGYKMLASQGIDAAIELHDSPSGSVKRRAPDISKLVRLTGYSPAIDLEAGLKATIEYYKDGKLAPYLS